MHTTQRTCVFSDANDSVSAKKYGLRKQARNGCNEVQKPKNARKKRNKRSWHKRLNGQNAKTKAASIFSLRPLRCVHRVGWPLKIHYTQLRCAIYLETWARISWSISFLASLMLLSCCCKSERLRWVQSLSLRKAPGWAGSMIQRNVSFSERLWGQAT